MAERSKSQLLADENYKAKLKEKKRFGGYCSTAEKNMLVELAAQLNITEKEVIFKLVKKEFKKAIK